VTTRHTDESIKCLRQAVLIDSTFLITADSDERFSNVAQEKEKLKKDLRGERRKVIEHLRERLTVLRKDFDSARDVAEEVGITDFNSLIRDTGTLGNRLDEIDRLCVTNSYLDLLKVERLAHDVYKEGVGVFNRNVEECVTVRKASISKLKDEGNKILRKSYIGLGLLVFFGCNLMTGILISLGVTGDTGALLIFIFSVIMAILTPSFYKNLKITPITNEIEKEKNAIARLSNLKK